MTAVDDGPVLATGNAATDLMLPAAVRLVCAVHDKDHAEMAAAFDAADEVGTPRQLALALAALVRGPDAITLGQLLDWHRDTDDGPRNRGQAHPKSRLTTVQVAAMRATFRPHVPGDLARVSRQFNVSRQTAHSIVTYRTRVDG